MQPWVELKTCATATRTQPLYTGCTLQLSYRDASIHSWENVWFEGQLSSISIKINTDQTKNLLLIEIQTQHNCVYQFVSDYQLVLAILYDFVLFFWCETQVAYCWIMVFFTVLQWSPLWMTQQTWTAICLRTPAVLFSVSQILRCSACDVSKPLSFLLASCIPIFHVSCAHSLASFIPFYDVIFSAAACIASASTASTHNAV